jgi:NADPH:quinone reductase-like Zn-dependent oxidoreductase
VRAIVMRDYGGPECLVSAEQPAPVADPGWAAVQLPAASTSSSTVGTWQQSIDTTA